MVVMLVVVLVSALVGLHQDFSYKSVFSWEGFYYSTCRPLKAGKALFTYQNHISYLRISLGLIPFLPFVSNLVHILFPVSFKFVG